MKQKEERREKNKLQPDKKKIQRLANVSTLIQMTLLVLVIVPQNTREDFQSRWWHRLTWLVSLHNHIKITTKLENNHHSELAEIEVNGSLTTT